MFRFNFATEMWTSTTNLKSWKLMPYPKPFEGAITEATLAYRDIASADEASMAYLHIDIWYPISARNVPMVQMCIDLGVDVNKRLEGASHCGMTPLMKAVATAYEYTPLPPFNTITTLLVVRRDSRKIIQLLLEHGANPNEKDYKGINARQMAEYPPSGVKDHFDGCQPDWFIQELLKPTPNVNLGHLLPMTNAVWAGDAGKIEAMFAENPDLCHLAESHGVSPLGIAVYRRDNHMVEFLLDKGASPNALDLIGFSPLIIAVASDSKDLARLLLQRGAILGIPDPSLGLTALEYTAREGHHDMCRTLLGHLKDQLFVCKSDILSKPLALAVRRHHADVVRLLLDHGADVLMNMHEFLQPAEISSLNDRYGNIGNIHMSLYDFVAFKGQGKVVYRGDLQSKGWWNGDADSKSILAIIKSYETRAYKARDEARAFRKS